MLIRYKFIGLLCCCLLAVQARGNDGGDAAQPTVQDVVAQQQQIRGDLQAGDEKYRYLDPIRRRQVYADQREVFALLEGRQSLSELSADQQLALHNALERIKSALAKRAGDEMVCERVAIAGTKRQEMACMTKAERERRAKSAKESLMFRPACTTSDCAGGGG